MCPPFPWDSAPRSHLLSNCRRRQLLEFLLLGGAGRTAPDADGDGGFTGVQSAALYLSPPFAPSCWDAQDREIPCASLLQHLSIGFKWQRIERVQLCDPQPRAGTGAVRPLGAVAAKGCSAQPCAKDLVLRLGCKQHPELYQQRHPAPGRLSGVTQRNAQHQSSQQTRACWAQGGSWVGDGATAIVPAQRYSALQHLGCSNPSKAQALLEAGSCKHL